MKAIPKRTLLVTCIIILLPMFFGLALWNRLPERMPTHFDLSGTADDYSGRPFAVIGLPLFILAMQLFCAVMLRADPKKQNISEKMAQLILWVCPAVSLFAGLSIYLSALGFAINVSRFGMVFVGLLFIAIGNYLPKCRHNYTVGIRVPWTLDDEDNWNHTHRFAGYVWIIAGVVTLLSVFLSHATVVWVAAIFVASLSPLVYSFVYAKRHGKI